MRHVLMSRQQHNPQQAVTVAGQQEPVEPAYMKPLKPSGLSASNRVPSEPHGWEAPIVHRGQNTDGMRYLYAIGNVRQPLQEVGHGTDLGIAVWSGEFQPEQNQRHNWGFYDRLFQAGYPGFNLGLSFKVAELQKNATGGPGYNMRMNVMPRFVKVQRVNRAGGGPQYYDTQSAGS